jgi:LSD1 subclass zinc finger protein
MSLIKAQCPSCQTPLRLPEGTVGKKVRCPRCKEVFPLTADLVMAPTRAQAPPEDEFEDANATLSPAARLARNDTFKLKEQDEGEAPRKKKAAPRPSALATFVSWLLVLGYCGAVGAVWFGYFGDLPPVPGGDPKANVKPGAGGPEEKYQALQDKLAGTWGYGGDGPQQGIVWQFTPEDKFKGAFKKAVGGKEVAAGAYAWRAYNATFTGGTMQITFKGPDGAEKQESLYAELQGESLRLKEGMIEHLYKKAK